MGKGKDIIDLCHLLKPTEYGIDMLKVMCGEANDVSWMSRRYKK